MSSKILRMQILLLLAVLLLAKTNGTNDNFKGVAALYGSRVAGYWTSLGWASVSGLVVSMTHVSGGVLVGAAANGGRSVDRKVMTHIVLSWIFTLLIGGLFGALVYWAVG